MGQGNYALASHHVSNIIGASGEGLLFSPLQHAKTGQMVYLTDKSNIYEYQTDKVAVISPTQGSVILDESGKKEVTLITCDSDDAYRIEVQGQLVKTVPFDSTTARWFSSAYTQYWK